MKNANWTIYNHKSKDHGWACNLKVGTIIRIEENLRDNQEQTITKNVRYGIVGTVNECKGINDEYTEEGITHFTEDFVSEIQTILKRAEDNFSRD